MPARLLSVLRERERARHRAPAPYESEAAAEDAWIEQYQAKRRRFGLLSGIFVVPASNTGVVRLVAPNNDRVVKLITITPNGGNSGTIYISAGGHANPNTGFPLTKTSVPLVLADVLLGDLSACGTNSGDSFTWIGSGTPHGAVDEED